MAVLPNHLGPLTRVEIFKIRNLSKKEFGLSKNLFPRTLPWEKKWDLIFKLLILSSTYYPSKKLIKFFKKLDI